MFAGWLRWCRGSDRYGHLRGAYPWAKSLLTCCNDPEQTVAPRRRHGIVRYDPLSPHFQQHVLVLLKVGYETLLHLNVRDAKEEELS
jgi:hypothetical protein